MNKKNVIISGVEGGGIFTSLVEKYKGIDVNKYYVLAVMHGAGEHSEISFNYCISIGEGYYDLSIIHINGGHVSILNRERIEDEFDYSMIELIWNTTGEYLERRWNDKGIIEKDFSRMWEMIPDKQEEFDLIKIVDIEDINDHANEWFIMNI